jgi:flagellar hook-associated protein 1
MVYGPWSETDMSTFSGIEIASRALRVNQQVVDVIGHNVANVNTPGYSRQTAHITETDPYTNPTLYQPGTNGQFGTGVELTAVTRARDEFVAARQQSGMGDQGRLNQLRDYLSRIQDAYAEPAGGGLSSMITDYFNSFQEVARNPENSAARILLRQRGQTLTQQIRNLHGALGKVDQDVQAQVAATVRDANDLARQVAGLNDQIRTISLGGGHANDLMDKRDQLVQKLGTLVGAKEIAELDASGQPTGAVNVVVNGYSLVAGDTAYPLPTTFTTLGGVPQLTNGTDLIPVTGGEVAGLIEATTFAARYRADLNTLASTLIGAVNTQHAAGYGLDGGTGRNFFSGTDASDIGIDPAILADPKAIAAASAPLPGQPVAPGNGENARAMAAIASQALFNGDTIGTYYGTHVSQIGSDVKSAETAAANQQQVNQQLETLRSSVSGVSLDEEMTHMLQFQRSYQAAARMLSTFDSLLETIINDLGR